MNAIEELAGGHPVTPPSVLSIDERAALLECEDVIRKGQETFWQVGCALQRIRDSKLYRETHATFEAYCEDKWDMTDRFARMLRSAAEVVSHLVNCDFERLPATESQARPIAKLPREEWAPTWVEALDTAPDGKVTAGHVVNVVQRRLNRLSGCGTEHVAKECTVHSPQSPAEKVIDLPDLSSREKRIRAVSAETLLRLRELEELLAGYTAASGIRAAILDIDQLQRDVHRREGMVAARERKGAAL